MEEEREEGYLLFCWLVSGFGIKGFFKKLIVNYFGYDFLFVYCFSFVLIIEWEVLM